MPKPATVFSSGAAPCLVWVRTGRTWRVKGRIWSRIGAVVWSKKRSVACSAGPSASACGISPISAGRAASEKALELARPAWTAASVAGNSTSDSWIACCSLAKLPSAACEPLTKRSISASRRPSSVVSSAEVVDHAGERQAPRGDRLVDVGEVVDEGLEAAEGAGELAAAAADPFGAAGEQQLDVLAGVGVEGGEEGVEVGVRFGLGERDVVAFLEMPGRRPRGRPRRPCR